MSSRKRTHSQVEEPSLKERARSACASGEGTTTSELRDIARQLGIRNVSAMSKTKLCEAIHTNISQDEPVYPVTLDESDIPDGLQDPISLELMQDPIIASDGYSYDRVTLRNLFVAAQREFVAAGRPRNRSVTVRSLFDREVVLANPFGDIGGLPASFPLLENKSLARTIAEWRTEHGFDAPDSSQVGAAAAINAEPPESRRDDEGFHNGIFVGPSADLGQHDDEFDDSRVVRTRREVPFLSHADDDGFLAPEMTEVEFDEISFSTVPELDVGFLWFYYQRTQTRNTLIKMLGYVAWEENMDSPLVIESGGIDRLKPDLAQNQSMYDWHNNVVKKIMQRAVRRRDQILRQRDVTWGLTQAAPEQFQLLLRGRSQQILMNLLDVVQKGSANPNVADLSFRREVYPMLFPLNGQSWSQWKGLIEGIMEHALDDQRGIVDVSDVYAIFPQS